MPAPAYVNGKRGKTIRLQKAAKTFSESPESTRTDSGVSEQQQGVPEITDRYLAELDEKLRNKKIDHHERAQAANEVRQRLDDFQREHIASFWYSVEDLAGPGVPQPSRKAVLKLLKEVAKRCEDASLRKIYLSSTLELLRSLIEAGEITRSDPCLELLLSCLKECLSGAKTLLSDEDSALLKSVIEMILNVALDFPDKISSSSALMLIEIVMEAPICGTSRLKLIDFLSTFVAGSNFNDKRLISCIPDYVCKVVQEHDNLISSRNLHQIAILCERTSSRSKSASQATKLGFMLNTLAQSSCGSEFLDLLLDLGVDEQAKWDHLIELFACSFFESLLNQGGGRAQIDPYLNRLYYMKKDKINLKLMGNILEYFSGCKQTDIGGRLSTDSIIWSLVKSILSRLDERPVKNCFVNVLLKALNKNHSITPPSIDKMIQLICEQELPIDFSSLISLLSSRRRDVYDALSLNAVATRVLAPDIPQQCQWELLDLLLSLVQDPEFKLLTDRKLLFSLIENVFLRGRTIKFNNAELLLVSNLTFQCLQRLPAEYFTPLIHDQILLDIKAILTKRKRRKSIVNTIGHFGRNKQADDQPLLKVDVLVECLVKSFIWSATDVSGEKTLLLFDALNDVYVVAEKGEHEKTLLTIARAMVRIRCDSDGLFYFANPKDAVGISSALGRFKQDLTDKDEDVKWSFPEKVPYIDESLLNQRNKSVLFAGSDKSQDGCINMAHWLAIAVNTIKAPIAWDIYSYLITHLCSQMSEVALFHDHPGLVNDFKNVICEHLTRSLPTTVEMEGSTTRCDLQAAFVRNLSSVLAYHPYEPKTFADEIIRAIVIGLSSWEKTLIPVLHILSVSCFEVPLSVQKNLSPMLLQIQKRITNVYAIPSILEFFLALKNSPTVITNLRTDEIKRIFAIVFKLIENSVDLTLRSKARDDVASKPKLRQPQNQEYEVDVSSSTQTFLVGEPMADFYEYQSFIVLTSWFLCLDSARKKELFPFVISGLHKLQNVEGLQYDVLAHIDFVTRSQFISQGHWNIDDGDSEVNDTARWIYKSTLISIEAKGRKVIITVWKPTCTLSFGFEPIAKLEQPTYDLFGFENRQLLKTEFDDLSVEDCSKPKALLVQLCYLLGIPESEQDQMLRIPNDPILTRSINSLRRIPNKELQKAGIVYIGKNQNSEVQVLSNAEGSYQYNFFLNEMGYFIKLSEKSKLFYTGGLENELDGEYALIWSDEISQIAFHTTTLMPNGSEPSSKKKHVGNNFVNIFYDESGLPDFNFNIIKSQFTFISIVITPQTSGEPNKVAEHYKVKLYRRTGTPGLSSCAHFKIITRPNLARYVRHISQIANALALKTHEQHSPYACSAWGIRCKHLDTIRERVVRSHSATPSS